MDYPIKSAGLVAVMLLSYSPGGSAVEDPVTGANDDMPSLEFLEFLGSFETDSGDWINPGELMQPDFEQLLESAENAPDQDSDSGEQDNDGRPGDTISGDEV